MQRRLFALILAGSLAFPAAALADASADGLGPATSTGGTSSSADGSALQPAGTGTSTLQPSSGAGNGLSASNDAAGTLQQPATANNGQLQVLLGADADGASHAASTAHSAGWYALWIVFALILIGFGLVLLRRSSLRGRHVPLADIKSQIDSSSDKDRTQESSAPITESAETNEEADQPVQTSEMPPPNVGETTKKTGDSGGKHRKKHKKRRSGRSKR